MTVAVKCLKNDALAGDKEALSEFVREVNALLGLEHPHLIRLYGIVLSPKLMMVCTVQDLVARSKLMHTPAPHPNNHY